MVAQHFHHHREDGSMSWMTGQTRPLCICRIVWIILFPLYMAIGGSFTGRDVYFGWYTHGLASLS